MLSTCTTSDDQDTPTQHYEPGIAPVGTHQVARSTRSNRAARDRARHHGHRTRRAAQNRTPERVSNDRARDHRLTPPTRPTPTTDRRTLTHHPRVCALRRALALATRSPHSATRSAAADRPTARPPHALIDLPEAGRPGGPPPTQQSAAPPPTEGWRLWSGEDGSARQTRVCAWAAGAPHEMYTIRSAWIQKQGGSPISLQNSKEISRKVPETIRDSNRQRQRDLGRLHK